MKFKLYWLVDPDVNGSCEADESPQVLLDRLVQTWVGKNPPKGNLSHHPAKTQAKLVGQSPAKQRKPVKRKVK